MAKLKWVCFSFTLMLLLNLGVASLKRNEKWVNDFGFGYDGGFCLPGVCFGGGGGGGLHSGIIGGGLNWGFGGGGGLHLGIGGSGPHFGIGGGGPYFGIGGSGGAYFDAGGSGTNLATGSSGGRGGHLGAGRRVGSATYLGAGGGPVSFARGTEVRKTMYCTPVSCTTNECSGLHIHVDKGLYNSLMSKYAVTNNKEKHPMSAHHMPQNFQQNGNIASKREDVQDFKQAAIAPESN